MNANILISLVCATQHRHAELRRLLESLASQTCNQFELILVDQNESDLIVDLVEEFQKKISIIHVHQNFSSNTKARNIGAEKSTGSWIGFPDDDCWYSQNAIGQLVEECNESYSGIFIAWTDNTGVAEKKMFSFETDVMTITEAFTLASCICLFIRREVFISHHGFNEKMGLGTDTLVKAGEEQDLMLRIISGNGEIVKIPQVEVHHAITERPWNDNFKMRIISQGACDAYFTRKYKSPLAAFGLELYWIGGIIYNLILLRSKNIQWYFYKLKGALTLTHKL